MIRISKLSKKFGSLRALDSVDLELARAGIYAVIGPNGSGKTTLIKSLLGMVIPDSGMIEVNGGSIAGQYRYRSHIAYLPQIARFPENLTAGEFLEFIQQLRGAPERKPFLLNHFDVAPVLGKKLRNLSGGTRQKINLVACMMYDCQVLVLDEPTAGLDPVSLVRLKVLLRKERERGKIILLTTHILDLVQSMADEVIILLEGRLRYQGTPSDLMQLTETGDMERATAALMQMGGEERAQAAASPVLLTNAKEG